MTTTAARVSAFRLCTDIIVIEPRDAFRRAPVFGVTGDVFGVTGDVFRCQAPSKQHNEGYECSIAFDTSQAVSGEIICGNSTRQCSPVTRSVHQHISHSKHSELTQ